MHFQKLPKVLQSDKLFLHGLDQFFFLLIFSFHPVYKQSPYEYFDAAASSILEILSVCSFKMVILKLKDY